MPDYPPITGIEGLNPSRRFKVFRPRQMMAGYGGVASPNGYATIQLYNNSTGQFVLAVIYASYSPSNAAGTQSAGFYLGGGPISTNAGVQSRIITGEAALPGQIWTLDSPSITSPFSSPYFAWGDTNQGYSTIFPIAVIQPGQSMVFQCATQTDSGQCAFMWEAILPDELDYFY